MDQTPDILCISSIDWDFIWQGHQQIMSTLAADGHRVLFLENTGVRAPQVRDLPRLRQRVKNWWRGTKGFREERPNLFVYSPLLLPLPYSRIARWVNRFVLLRALGRWMRATGFHRPVVWTFLPTPLALDLARAVDPQATIYYCIDDLQSSSLGARRIVTSEERLFREADLVFVTSENLRKRAAGFSSRVHLFPFGVNFEQFDRVRQSGEPPPADLQALRDTGKPIVGYVGGLHQWIDQALVAEVANAMPDAAFAFIGPAQTDVSALERCPNIRLFGQRSHADVARYVKGFDVGIVPYRLSDYTANVYPTKLNEYLVMGVPVVATDLPEIRRFNADHGDIVEIGVDAGGFAGAIRRSLAAAPPSVVERRMAVAQSNSWASRIAAMKTLIDGAVERRAASSQRWDETLRRVYRQTRMRIATAVLALLAVYLLVFQTNLLWQVAEPLRQSAAPRRVDVIVVFAGGVGESGKAGGGAQERLKQAIDLYKAGWSPYLVLSSGYVYSFREAESMRALAIDQGVPAGNIVLEQRATNTYENVTFVNDILADHRWTSILLVSSPYHMRRALGVWHKVAPGIAVVPAPPASSQFYDHTRGATLEQVRGIAQEYLAMFAVLAARLALSATLRKLLRIALPATLLAGLLGLIAIEIGVRAAWEPRRGRPGLFLTDAARGQRLAAGYDGWFAGVPARINSLELRDGREYDLAKQPGTFRILVLGDSVTFGHGSVYEHTYPYLLEQRLRAWKPGVNWQVWNAGVPGYNASQELAHLLEVGDRFQPDLVVVGFFENDLIGNQPIREPAAWKAAAARVLSLTRRYVYSFELYKKVYLSIAWRLFASEDYRRRLGHLATEESLLEVADASALTEQQLTPFERLTNEQVRGVNCVYGMKPNPDTVPAIERDREYAAWVEAVRGFQRLDRDGRFRVVFFVNNVPPVCPDGDVFYDGGSKAIDELYLRVMGDGTPAVSCYDAFLHMRPSQMPNARAHAIGNANLVKAGVLFDFLRDRVLPARERS